MAKGGYQIIDFKGAVIGSTAITVPDAFKKATQGKAILFENVKINALIPAMSVFTYGIAAAADAVYCCAIAVGNDGPQAVIVTIGDDDSVEAALVDLAIAE